MYTLVQLRQFVAVAEEMHFGRAAERLHMTQPPLSRQMQLLEKELAVDLFDRSSRSIRLTSAGKAFHDDARRLLLQAERAALSVRKASAGQSGVLRVGFTGGSVNSGLAAVLRAARSVIEDVELDLRELVTMAQLDALSDGSLDIGLVRPAGHPAGPGGPTPDPRTAWSWRCRRTTGWPTSMGASRSPTCTASTSSCTTRSSPGTSSSCCPRCCTPRR